MTIVEGRQRLLTFLSLDALPGFEQLLFRFVQNVVEIVQIRVGVQRLLVLHETGGPGCQRRR